jgi:hypothetical protein
MRPGEREAGDRRHGQRLAVLVEHHRARAVAATGRDERVLFGGRRIVLGEGGDRGDRASSSAASVKLTNHLCRVFFILSGSSFWLLQRVELTHPQRLLRHAPTPAPTVCFLIAIL